MAAQVSWSLGTEEISSPSTLKAAFAELVATALFLFMGVGSIMAMIVTAPDLGGGIVIVAGAFGLSIGLLAAGIGGVSGGHINPAVSFAMVLTGQISVARGAIYIVAQLLGAVIGMLLLKAFTTSAAFDLLPGMGGNIVSDSTVPSDLAAVGIEATITFLLVWTIFATAVSPKGVGSMAPLFIGFAVFVIHLMAIPFTGTGANPARTFGPAVVMGEWDGFWIYVLGPLIGAALAALSYTMLFLTDSDEAT